MNAPVHSFTPKPQSGSSPARARIGVLERKCACGGTPGPTGECEECRKKRLSESQARGPAHDFSKISVGPQPKLEINHPDDRFEQDADRMANYVVNGITNREPVGPISPLPQPQLVQHEDAGIIASEPLQIGVPKNTLERRLPERPSQSAPAAVGAALRENGQPLSAISLGFMARRFGYDFSRVRVHTDARANEGAHAVNAHAYTVGEHIVFARGRYAPSTLAGQKLLAHELTHVVQQHAAREISLQRDEAKPEDRIDVAIVFGEEPDAMVEGRSYAPTAIRVTSGEDAKNKLLALGKPIGRIYVVSHSTSAGQVQVISGIGTISWVKLSDLSKDLKGIPTDKAPTDIDFRGCKLGEAPQEMETFRKNVGATRARAMTCWSIVQVVTPLVLGGKPLTSPTQIPQGKEREVDQALLRQINSLKSDDGHAVKDCIEGLAPGEKADRNLAKIKQIYFQHKGNLSATWASPEYNHEWQEGSMCVKDLTANTNPCKIVTTSAPAATTGGAGGKSTMIGEPAQTRYAGDLVSTKEGEQVA